LGSQSSHCSWVVSDIDTLLLEEISTAEFYNLVIEILTSQMGVTGGGLDFKHTLINGKE
jgi:hypothetical protein